MRKNRQRLPSGAFLDFKKGKSHEDDVPQSLARIGGIGAGAVERLPDVGSRSRHHRAVATLSAPFATVFPAIGAVSVAEGASQPGRGCEAGK